MDLRPLLNVCRIFQSNIHLSSWLGVIFTCTLIHIVFKYFNGIVNSILLYYFNVNERIYVSWKFKPIPKTRKMNEMAIKCENKWNLQHLHCDVIYNICDRKPMIT